MPVYVMAHVDSESQQSYNQCVCKSGTQPVRTGEKITATSDSFNTYMDTDDALENVKPHV